MESRRFSEAFYNIITYLGVVISLLVLTTEVFLFAIDFFSHGSGGLYLGLVTYLILPAFLFFGLALIPLGVMWKKNRMKKGLPAFELRRFRIDLALPTHRNALLVFIVGTAIVVLMSLVGSYQAYHYTESVAFCGTLCHKVMEPEHTAYMNSPHGKVMCVDCHIGPGAGWFVKSKASGLRQVYRTALDSFDRPIKTPIHNLRPAQETCLQCHSPGKYFSTVDFIRTYYLSEQDQKKWHIRMMMKVGAGKENYGVHAHMNVDHDIYYAAEDDRRQKITWVRAVGKDGSSNIFTTKTSQWKDVPPPDENIKKMDCVDCHNRPTHIFQPADRLMNFAMARGEIDPAIPDIKVQGMKLLSDEYSATQEAQTAIRDKLLSFYKESHGAYYQNNAGKIDQAISAVQSAFANNIFPRMKTRWDSHPDNIGHMNFPGCFRCHDGKHKAEDGKTISRDCNACHLIVEQGPEGKIEKDIEGLEFQHPDGEEDWKTTPCTKCHTGTVM